MKNLYSLAIAFVLIFSLSSCGSSDESASSGSIYHINYFETAGNAARPVTTGREQSVALWFEVDSPYSPLGKVWVDDMYLERSDFPGINLISNSGFEFGLWSAKNNALCLASDVFCKNIIESNDSFVWQVDRNIYFSGNQSSSVDMSKLGLGYQSHIFQLITFPSGIPAGITFRAHAMIKIEGDVQARLGVDLREVNINPSDPRGSITNAVNGLIIRGNTNGWRMINLR